MNFKKPRLIIRRVISPQLYLAMKLTICIFFLSMFGVLGNVTAQRINLNAKEMPLEKALIEISKQSKYVLVYDEKDLNSTAKVTCQLKDKELSEALKIVLSKQPVHYEIKGKSIVISKIKKKDDQYRVITNVQQDVIRGRVTDSTGTALAGVTVHIRGTNLRTATNSNGEYQFTNIDKNAILTFSYIGFTPTEITYAGSNTINTILTPSLSTLQEVEVNAGYWKVNDKLRTGNISKVEGKTIQQQPVLDPMLALAGRVPGVVISQNSGLPGAYHSVRIRGNNSLANGNDPLFLVDGLPFTSATLSNSVNGTGATRLSPFSLLNADDIESIEVLKDADATAIYGSRGANGVILITTKKGRAGKTAVNLSGSTGFGKVNHMLDMLNTEQYLEMRREAFANDGVTTYPDNDYDVNGTWNQDRYTDWQKVLIGNTSRMSNFQGQVSGGTTLTQFLAGGGYTKETTVFPGDYNTKRGNASFNLNHQSENKKFNFSLSTRYANNLTDQPQFDFSHVTLIGLAPNSPAIYDEEGNLNWENETWDNPLAMTKSRSKLNSKNLIANTTLRYQILEPLEIKLNLGYNDLSTLGSNTSPSSGSRPSWSAFPSIRSHDQAESSLNTWIIEPQLNYNSQFWIGKLEATVGTTFQSTKNKTLALFAHTFSDDAMIENLMAAAVINVVQNQQIEYRYAALFARANYNLCDKYILNLVARRDGSTRFAPDRKYGNFASLGGAWLFAKEALFKGSFLSFGKIRASYGVTGNDQLTDYQYLKTYSSFNYPYLGMTGLYPTRLYSSDYGWEAVRKIEVALDLGFIADRIKLSTIYYRNRTDNQLVGYPLPTMTGFPSIQGNLPAVLENKGWEWELNTVNISGEQLNWSTSFNISVPDSKLIAYPDLENSTYRNTYEIGKPLSISKKFHWTGVDPKTGIHTYEDVNDDGKITSPQDLQALVNLGRRFYGGISNSISYKGISLDIFFQFVKKKGRMPISIPGVAFINQPTWVMDRWQNSGDATDVQRFTQAGIAFSTMETGMGDSDLIYEDASFLRLKNLSMSYQLPTKLVKTYKLGQCRIFAQAQNLLTFTPYRGLDPETEYELPAIRMITAGINLTF